MKFTLIALAMFILIAACGQPDPQPAPATVRATLPTEIPTSAPDVAVAVATGVAATMEALPLASATTTATPEPPPTHTVTPKPPPAHTATPTSAPTALPTASPTPAATHTPPPSPTPTLAHMVEEIAPGLVYIETSTGSGSGFIIDADGLVVTNAHVVERFESVDVALADGSEYTGNVLGVDEIADLALVRLQSSDQFEAMRLGNSDDAQVGDDVIALGFPLLYELGSSPTVTRGIISSKRAVNGVEELQTDAAINPGNSGGPLVDRHGSVIGVNYAELALSDGSPVDNIGFSVAINELKSRMDALARGDNMLLPTPTPGVWTEYRNEDFGYAMDIAPGWYLDEETDDGDAKFWNEDGTASLDVFTYDLSEAAFSLTEFAEYVRDDWVELAQEDAWDVFEIIDFAGVRRGGDEYYWLEYRWRSSDEYCVSRGVELIVVSSHYPAKPYGFNAVGTVCERNYDYLAKQVNDMVGSLVDWTTPRTALAPSPTPTPEPWTQYRNEEYGYSIDLAPGWYLDEETDEGDASFWSADDAAFLDVFMYDLSDDQYTLAEFATSIRDNVAYGAQQDSWEVFDILDFAEVRRDGTEYYWLEYNWQESDEYCVTNISRYIVLSSLYPTEPYGPPRKPYGFSVNGGMCEHRANEYSEQLNAMIGSFEDWATPRTIVFVPRPTRTPLPTFTPLLTRVPTTPTPEPWTQHRNDEYGYAIDIAPGWYLDEYAVEGDATFWSSDDSAFLQIFVYDLSGYPWTTGLLANSIRDEVSEDYAQKDSWEVFEILDFSEMRRDGDRYYRLEYNSQKSEDDCVTNLSRYIVLSSRYPTNPYGFSVNVGVCEVNIDAYADIVASMIASFLTY